jgi:hypothetical protein
MINKGQAKKAKDDLDEKTKALRGLISYAGETADALCAAGDHSNSAIMRKVQGYLTLAYGEGRMLNIPVEGGGEIQPMFGGGK